MYRRIEPSAFDRAMALLKRGTSVRGTARQVGVSRSAVRYWAANGRPRTKQPTFETARRVAETLDHRRYSYLLGMYLGDGCISHLVRTTALVISHDSQYEAIIDECADCLAAIAPGTVRRQTRQDGSVLLVACWGGWPILFPQHGPGKKHERRIELVDWQKEITCRFTREFIRGLIHSDGSRCMNRFSVKLPSGRVGRYAYPRYFFTNYSKDIQRIFCEHCELLGIRWTQSNPRNISVSHRDSVALLDQFVGPKA
jgi:RNase P subunit RPR2